MSDRKLGARLYGDARMDYLNDRVKVACNHRGIVNCHKIAAAQAQARSQYQPLLTENPDLPLEQFKELVDKSHHQSLPEVAVAARAEHVVAQRIPVYETPRQVRADLAAVKAANKAKDVLNTL